MDESDRKLQLRIDPEQERRIVEEARITWGTFLNTEKEPADCLVLPDQIKLADGRRVDARVVAAERFLSHCGRVHTSVRATVSLTDNLRAFPHDQHTWSGEAASWMINNPIVSQRPGEEAKRIGCPHVYLNLRLIREKVPATAINRFRARVLLHEAGHIALHWRRLVSDDNTTLRIADAREEAEAWFFAEVVYSHGLSAYAHDVVGGASRERSCHDDAWLYA